MHSPLRMAIAALAFLTAPMVEAAAQTPPAAALSRHGCGSAIERALSARGIAVDRLASLFVINSVSGGRESSRLDGYEAWAQPADQRGSIVVRVDTRCNLREVYARDGATLPRSP